MFFFVLYKSRLVTFWTRVYDVSRRNNNPRRVVFVVLLLCLLVGCGWSENEIKHFRQQRTSEVNAPNDTSAFLLRLNYIKEKAKRECRAPLSRSWRVQNSKKAAVAVHSFGFKENHADTSSRESVPKYRRTSYKIASQGATFCSRHFEWLLCTRLTYTRCVHCTRC